MAGGLRGLLGAAEEPHARGPRTPPRLVPLGESDEDAHGVRRIGEVGDVRLSGRRALQDPLDDAAPQLQRERIGVVGVRVGAGSQDEGCRLLGVGRRGEAHGGQEEPDLVHVVDQAEAGAEGARRMVGDAVHLQGGVGPVRTDPEGGRLRVVGRFAQPGEDRLRGLFEHSGGKGRIRRRVRDVPVRGASAAADRHLLAGDEPQGVQGLQRLADGGDVMPVLLG